MKRKAIFLLAILMVLAMVPNVALAAGDTVEVSTPAELGSALAAADADDTVKITADMALTTQYVIKTGVTLTASPGVVVSVSGVGDRFYMQPDSKIEKVSIEKTDKAGEQNIIYVQSSCVVKNCTITGKYVFGEGDVARAMVIQSGATNILIEGNTIRALRQPAYVNGCTGQIKNNYVSGTRGWVIACEATCSFTGNVFGGNVFDFAIIAQGTNAGAYDDIAALSAANNGAYVEYQLTNPRLYASAGIAFPAGGGTTEVTAGVDPSYMIVIPSAVNFGSLLPGTGTSEQDFDVTAQDVIIETGRKIVVGVNSNFKMLAGGAELPYLLSNSDGVVLSPGTFATFTQSGPTFTTDGDVTVDLGNIDSAGSYQGTMTFTIAYQ